MLKKIIVNILPEETRVALFEDGQLAEVLIERKNEHWENGCAGKIAGNIYKGKVKNVLPGMQAVFIDIGEGKNAFLHLGGDSRAEKDNNNEKLPALGQDIMVQVIKEPIGSKGPRVDTNLTLPGRYIVLMPLAGYTGVSRRIENEPERTRLREIAEKIRLCDAGFVVRTAAEGRSEEELVKDLNYLQNLWNSLKARYKLSRSPALLHQDADLAIRMARDYIGPDVEELVIDHSETYLRVADFVNNFSPELKNIIKLYKNESNVLDIFSHYGIELELVQLNQRRIELKSGGYIIIDYTEALTVIDVNTGKYVGVTNLAQTVFETNLEAAAEIVRQIRLRDIGGIIIIDFIDMQDAAHKNAILAALEEHLKKDRAKSSVIGLTKLGLIEITRKKVRQNIGAMYHECPCCAGKGRIKSPEALLFDIKRELLKINRQSKPSGGQLLIQVHPFAAELLKKPDVLKDIEIYANRALAIEYSAKINPEMFSILWKP